MQPSIDYIGITGTVGQLSPLQEGCCNQDISLHTQNGMVHFILSPTTYVADHTPLRTGMQITAFYDANQPIPLIYPPRYQAAFLARTEPDQTIIIAYFNEELLSTEYQLQLRLGSKTHVSTANGQYYPCSLGNRLLMVYYRALTRSIPAQTTPDRIIVFC
ncbi:MAG: hypothetical protein IKM28_00125 [Lachnospiraceae bacterium]|nr:hypothetical protein [Lachnospiraceae bacterium]